MGLIFSNPSSGISVSTANVTYYVRKDGSDSNTGLVDSAGGAFLTIGKAVSMLPQIINHTMPIVVGAGTYAEDVVIKGFLGKGYTFLKAAVPNVVSDSYIVQSIVIEQCSIYVEVNGIKASRSTEFGFSAARCQSANFLYCKIDSVGAFIGFSISNSFGQIANSVASNRSQGIRADLMSTLYSSTNSGTGNTNGLVAGSGATIGKNSTQPAGTTPELTSGGGVIR